MKFKTIAQINLVIAPGRSIRDACHDALQVVFNLHHPVYFEFNSRIINAVPGDSVNDLLDAWHKVVNSINTQENRVYIRTGRKLHEGPPEKKHRKPKEEKPCRAPRRIVL